jgi:hypothetical protein
MAQFHRCPNDGATLTQIANTDRYKCPTCDSTWRASDGGLVDPLPPLPKFMIDAFIPVWAQTDASLAKIDAGSTGTIARVERMETQLTELKAAITDSDQRRAIERLAVDAAAAIDSARGAQGAARKLQEDIREVRTMIEELGLTTLRVRLMELEQVVDRHIANHEREPR